MPITQLECFRATVAHKPHEAIIAHASYTDDLARRLKERYGLGPKDDISRHLGLTHFVSCAPRPTEATPKQDFSPYFKDVAVPEGARITEWGRLMMPGKFYHFTHTVSALRNATTFEEIKAFPYPVYVGYDESHLAGQVAAAHAQGRVACGAIGHIFECSWQCRDIEQFLTEMAMAPERCEYIFDRFYEWQKGKVCTLARAGVDLIHTGDDVATQRAMMFSVEQWRHFLKPRWGDIYAAAKAIKPDLRVWYHSDGNITAIIPELIEIGVDILNPVQPECIDVFEAKRRWGSQLVFDGCMGTQSTMPFGTPGEVRRKVHEYVEKLGYDGALILSPTHVLEPDVPIENIEAFAGAVKEYGTLI